MTKSPRFETLSDWLAWLESCHPQAIELGLERIRTVAEKLFQQSPLNFSNTKTVTIGGTNGKGSCVAFLDHILRAEGYRVACYTSPHLLHYNERCVIDGRPVSDQQLIEAFVAIDNARENISLTYFEFGTLAALWLFAQAKVDVMLLEVGLGGRLDAVNIVDADVSIVATVDIDHQDWLGDDREQIAIEKAGIFRAHRPAISGDPNPPENLQKSAQQISADWYGRGQQFDYQKMESQQTEKSWSWSGIDKQGNSVQLNDLPLPQLSLDNAATVLQALQLLDLPVKDSAIRTGLVSANVAGRFSCQRIQERDVIFDVAHNPAAARLLARHLATAGNAQETIAVFAVMADKDFAGIVEPLLSSISHWYLLPLLDVPRALPANQAAMQLRQYGATAEVLGNVTDIQGVIGKMNPQQRLIVFGSFYTVAAAMQLFHLDNVSSNA